MTTVQEKQDVALMAHLLRRAGFGATADELDYYMSIGYEATVEALLNPGPPEPLPDDLIRRYHVEQSDLRTGGAAGAHWMYRMVNMRSDGLLREKMCLLWHRVFATASHKLIQARVVTNQISMFREYGMGSFRDLLVHLSRDPAMLMWLDNQDNHKGSINENYGREILELFSMGVGNYTEEDIKECSRAFTGWRVVNPDYMSIKMRNNTARPYGYIAWQFEYDDQDHDHGTNTSWERSATSTARTRWTSSASSRRRRGLSPGTYTTSSWRTSCRSPNGLTSIRRTRRPSRSWRTPTSSPATTSPRCSGQCSTQTSSSRRPRGSRESRALPRWWSAP